MRTPKDVKLFDGHVSCYPAEPDDMGGGFPVISVEATIYGPKDLRKMIKALQKREQWIAKQAEKYGGER